MEQEQRKMEINRWEDEKEDKYEKKLTHFEDLLTFLARCTQIPPSREEGCRVHLGGFEEFVDHDGEFQYDLLGLSFVGKVDVE